MIYNNVSPLVRGIVENMFNHPDQWLIGKSKQTLANFDKHWALYIKHVGHEEVRFSPEAGIAAPAWAMTVEDSRALCIAVRDWVYDNVKQKENS